MDLHCKQCDMTFKSNKCLQQHFKCNRHIERVKKEAEIRRFECSTCGKRYAIRQSLHAHKKICVAVAPVVTPSVQEILELKMDEMKQAFEKERQEMKAQIALLLDKHAGTTTNNNNTTTNNNNIETQNINIIINSFGNENTDYIDDKAMIECIGRVYKSIPSLLEKIHFDPKHPENHNIKITNRKLPYASVMGNNQKWKTVDRKDAIDTMVNNSYNMLDDKFKENKNKISESKQEHFRGFQSRFDREDKELMKELKSEVDTMVLNGVL
jgi:hypothetical protein